jgi:hypothetical protein
MSEHLSSRKSLNFHADHCERKLKHVIIPEFSQATFRRHVPAAPKSIKTVTFCTLGTPIQSGLKEAS